MSEPAGPRPPEDDGGRVTARVAALQARARSLEERAQIERSRHASVDAAFEMVDRDQEVGGGIIAGALAYRLFIWLLPLTLVAVAGLGVTAHAAAESPEEVADSAGLAGLVSSSVANAASGSGRWYALLIGIPVLVYLTRSVLRALIGAHRLIWADVREAAPRPRFLATVRLLVLLLGFFAVSLLASGARARSFELGLPVTMLEALPVCGALAPDLAPPPAPRRSLDRARSGRAPVRRRPAARTRIRRLPARAVCPEQAGHLRCAWSGGRPALRTLHHQPPDGRGCRRQRDAVGTSAARPGARTQPSRPL